MSRLVFFSSENKNIASIRLRVLAIVKNIPGSIITRNISKIKSTDVVVINKTPELDDIQNIKKKCKCIIWDVCDNYFVDIRKDKAIKITRLCDHIVCSTDTLKSEIYNYTVDKNITVIEDPVYYTFSSPTFLNDPNTLKLVWYGNSYNLMNADWKSLLLDPIFDKQNELPKIILTIITENSDCSLFSTLNLYSNITTKFIPWSLDSQQIGTKEADIVVLPLDNNKSFVKTKSHNKLIDGLACGTMVIASPLESYLRFSEYCFIDNNFINSILYCINNKTIVLDKIAKGQEYINNNFTSKLLSLKWINLYNKMK